MTQKIHYAQLEVWEWKETLYNELQNVPRNNWAAYLNDSAKETINNLNRLKKEKQFTAV